MSSLKDSQGNDINDPKKIANLFKVDRESRYCAFLLRIKIIEIVLLLLLVHSPAFSSMS